MKAAKLHLLLLLSVVLTALVLYWPGLFGGIYFDDSHVLLNNDLIKLKELSVGGIVRAANSFLAGGREISMLSFALNYYFTGDLVFSFKLINLVLHLLTGVVLFFLCLRLVTPLDLEEKLEPNKHTFRNYVVLVAVSLWILAPINLGAVLYISQRMTILAFLFVAFGMFSHVAIRAMQISRAVKGMFLLVSLLLFTSAAYMSKENGILLPGYILLIELYLVGTSRIVVTGFASNRYTRPAFFIAVLGAVAVLAVSVWPIVEARLSYGGRDFTMAERVMTQFRAIGFYLSQILVPNNAELSMWHDDIPVSTSLFQPITTLIGLIVIFVLLSLAVYSWGAQPIIFFSIMWFFLGHSLESTIFPLEMMHEHRNYFASFGVFLLLAFLIVEAARLRWAFKLVVVAGLVVLNASALHARSVIWSDDVRKAAHEAAYHPDSPLAQFSYARLLFIAAQTGDELAGDRAKLLLERNRKLDTQTIANESLLFILAYVTGEPERTEWAGSAIEKLRNKGYTAISNRALSGLLEHAQKAKNEINLEVIDPIFTYVGSTEDPRLITFDAIFRSEVTFEYSRALALFDKASVLAPKNAVFATNYLRAQIKTRQFEAACESLTRIEGMSEKSKRFVVNQLTQARDWIGERCATRSFQ